MSIILWIIVFIAAIVVLFYLVGLFSNPTNKAACSKTLHYPLFSLWDYLIDVEGIPKRKREIKRIEILKQQGRFITDWKEFTDMGGHIVFNMEITPYVSVKKNMKESTFGLKGSWEYIVEGDEASTHITIKENSTISSPWLRALTKIVGKNANVKREMAVLERVINLQNIK